MLLVLKNELMQSNGSIKSTVNGENAANEVPVFMPEGSFGGLRKGRHVRAL